MIYFSNIVIPVPSCGNEGPLEGLDFLLRVVGDEISASEPILRLPSATGVGKDVEDVAKAGPVLFMIPGVEGMGSVLEPLAKNLKYQALCLQLGYNNTGRTVEDMAQALLPVQWI
jgi:fatty acid synthase